jgi:hypothetical protein
MTRKTPPAPLPAALSRTFHERFNREVVRFFSGKLAG